MTERLQKYLARTGAGSRREIEGWIRAGRVSVDGQTATLGLKVDENSRIAIDGTNVPEHSRASEQPRAILYHKSLQAPHSDVDVAVIPPTDVQTAEDDMPKMAVPTGE